MARSFCNQVDRRLICGNTKMWCVFATIPLLWIHYSVNKEFVVLDTPRDVIPFLLAWGIGDIHCFHIGVLTLHICLNALQSNQNYLSTDSHRRCSKPRSGLSLHEAKNWCSNRCLYFFLQSGHLGCVAIADNFAKQSWQPECPHDNVTVKAWL